MKKIFIFILTVFFVSSCANKRGELIGVKQKKWFPEKPYGMTLVEGGAYIMGKSDDDLAALEDAPTKTVTVRSYYMDETEITNAEYRQFVYWVRDSVIRTALADRAEDVLGGEPTDGNVDGIGEYAYIDADTSDLSVYDKYMKDVYEKRKLNWDTDLIFDRSEYPDEDYLEVMENFFIPEDEVFNDIRTWDVTNFKFAYLDSRVQEYLDEKQI